MSLKKASVGTLRSKTVTSYRFSSNRLSLRRFPFPSGPAVAAVVNYIEDVFSTYLYTGNGTTNTITNGIDLSTKGGLVWIKGRSGATGHRLTDTVRGATKSLESNSTVAEATESTGLTAFGTTGFTIGADADYNTNAATYVSWTFRKQAKFFDVVTYTGDGGSSQVINHSLGSTPGVVIVKRTDVSGENWVVYHRSLTAGDLIYLNTTDAAFTDNGTRIKAVSSTTFTVGLNGSTGANTGTYVAYLFAHNAGGFGLSGTDNVISCGSFTTDGSGNATVSLGYEPQWVLIKRSDAASSWFTIDNMRGFSQTQYAYLLPNTSGAESSSTTTTGVIPNATGFTVGSNFSAASATYIYIAIRRGPMKTPTSGTSVYNAITRSGSGSATSISGAGFPPDMIWPHDRPTTGYSDHDSYDRLRGALNAHRMNSTIAEQGYTDTLTSFNMDGFSVGADSASRINSNATNYVYHLFRRAPSFFDEVCFTSNASGGSDSQSHNLGITPELVIAKNRDGASDWICYANGLTSTNYQIILNTTAAQTNRTYQWISLSSTTFQLSNSELAFTKRYVTYLFASCPGVSKVGSYTGTGTTKQIDCGFTAGVRFVMIKRIDSTGDWYVWDSARGIVAGNDPYLLLNSTAAEVTNTDYIDPVNSGFEISSTAPAAINANGGTFIFLAIA